MIGLYIIFLIKRIQKELVLSFYDHFDYNITKTDSSNTHIDKCIASVVIKNDCRSVGITEKAF